MADDLLMLAESIGMGRAPIETTQKLVGDALIEMLCPNGTSDPYLSGEAPVDSLQGQGQGQQRQGQGQQRQGEGGVERKCGSSASDEWRSYVPISTCSGSGTLASEPLWSDQYLE